MRTLGEDDIGTVAVVGFQPLLTIAGGLHIMTHLAQQGPHTAKNLRLVIYQQQTQGRRTERRKFRRRGHSL